MKEKFTVLLVDDFEENIYSLKLLIEDTFDIEILTALNANDAFEISINKEVDLILSDVQMPDIDGFQFAEYLKTQDKTKNIPIIFITGIYDNDMYQKRGYELGAIEYISKPIDDTLLISKLSIYINLFNENKKNKESIEKLNDIVVHNAKMATLGEMIGLISHQLKQPLNVLSLYCDDIKYSYEYNDLNDDQVKDFSKNTKNQIKYMSDTIDDFLGYFNPNKSKEPFFICDSIDSSLDLLESIINFSNININKKIDNNFVLHGIKMEITQVIVNLVTNAIQAFEERGITEKEIVISAYVKEEKNFLIIEDNAGGINEKNLEKLFDPYFTTKKNGTGVGLYIVKLIVMNSFSGKLNLENSKNGLKFIMEW